MWQYFGQLVEIIGLLFIPASGHPELMRHNYYSFICLVIIKLASFSFGAHSVQPFMKKQTMASHC